MLYKPTHEQQIIIDNAHHHNLIIEAVPGAGKTTTILNLAKAMPDTSILLLTYNALLKSESRQKIADLDISNLEIHTFHSWGKKYINDECINDVALYESINIPYKTTPPHYDLVVVDEAQDLKKLYFQLVSRILTPATRLILLGDPMQSIYQYDGSTTDYLANKNNVWQRTFLRLTLRESHRLTRHMAAFMNEAVLGRDLIDSSRVGPPVTYIICDSYRTRYIHDLIMGHKTKGSKDADFFIGNYSLKLNRRAKPIHLLENTLVKSGLKFYKPLSDSSESKDSQIQDKIALTTWHQSKGRERPIVICYGMDDSFYKYYNHSNQYSAQECPGPMYVKLTRSSYKLYIIHDRKHSMLPFFKLSLEELKTKPYFKLVDLRDPNKVYSPIESPRQTELCVAVKELASRLTFEKHLLVKKLLVDTATQIPTEGVGNIVINNMISTRGSDTSYEDVSDLTGVIIPLMYHVKHNGLPDELLELETLATMEDYKYLFEKIKVNFEAPFSVKDITKLIVLHDAINNLFYHRVFQISRFDWIPESVASICVYNLEQVLELVAPTADPEPEVGIECNIKIKDLTIKIIGIMDYATDDTIIEIKTVKRLDIVHYLQILLYGWMRYVVENKECKLYLYSILSDELYHIQYSHERFNGLIKGILMARYSG